MLTLNPRKFVVIKYSHRCFRRRILIFLLKYDVSAHDRSIEGQKFEFSKIILCQRSTSIARIVGQSELRLFW